MRSATLIAALFSAAALAGPVNVVRGTNPDCEETSKKSPSSDKPSPYAGSANDGSASSGHDAGSATKPIACGATRVVSYAVQPGDTLKIIAEKYKSGICDIATTNNIKNPNLILAGQSLEVPIDCKTPDNTSCLPPPAPEATSPCVAGLPSAYNVQSGDTLSAIAKDFNITLPSLLAANKQISNPDSIQVGQSINIPVCPKSHCGGIGTYVIMSGDLFVDLASKYGSTVGQIKALNPNVDPTKTQPGDQIILPRHCMNTTAPAA